MSHPNDFPALYFATPVLLGADMDPEQQHEDMGQMLLRAQATADFVAGKISPADFEEALFQTGRDPYALHELWERGG